MFANRYTVLVDARSLVSVWSKNRLLSLVGAPLIRASLRRSITNCDAPIARRYPSAILRYVCFVRPVGLLSRSRAFDSIATYLALS